VHPTADKSWKESSNGSLSRKTQGSPHLQQPSLSLQQVRCSRVRPTRSSGMHESEFSTRKVHQMCEHGQGACVARHCDFSGKRRPGCRCRRTRHAEWNYQGKGNVLMFPGDTDVPARGPCNAASDWAGSGAITTKRQRNRTPKVQSRTLTPPLRSGDRGSPRNTLYYSVVPALALR
jgi:hypothetical protein